VLADLKHESEHVMSLIRPSNTYMVCIFILEILITLLHSAEMLKYMPPKLFMYLHSTYDLICVFGVMT
jgi:hypothetical protein